MTGNERDLVFYRRMLLIRRAEEKVRARYHENEMKTPVHLSIGQEAVAVGVCAALGPEDQLFGTYRSHALYLARTDDVHGFFAELYGRATGSARGKAGSMHLAAPDHGFLGTSAVVGTTIPVALGAALANRRLGNGKVVAAFFGDGAVDEGVFWESLNFACLAQLPIVFVCEDNGLAIHSKAVDRHGYDSIAEVIERFRCHVAASSSTDPEVLFAMTTAAIRQHRETKRPAFLQVKCHRYMEHVGVNEDYDQGYRTRAESEDWYRRDPVALVRARLLEGGVSSATLEAVDALVEQAIEAGVEAARSAPFPGPSELHEGVFA